MIETNILDIVIFYYFYCFFVFALLCCWVLSIIKPNSFFFLQFSTGFIFFYLERVLFIEQFTKWGRDEKKQEKKKHSKCAICEILKCQKQIDQNSNEVICVIHRRTSNISNHNHQRAQRITKKNYLLTHCSYTIQYIYWKADEYYILNEMDFVCVRDSVIWTSWVH